MYECILVYSERERSVSWVWCLETASLWFPSLWSCHFKDMILPPFIANVPNRKWNVNPITYFPLKVISLVFQKLRATFSWYLDSKNCIGEDVSICSPGIQRTFLQTRPCSGLNNFLLFLLTIDSTFPLFFSFFSFFLETRFLCVVFAVLELAL